MADRPRKRIAVFLINPDNPHQQHLKAVAVGAAARMQAEVVVHFAGSESAGSSVIQIRQVYEILSDKEIKFDAVIVHPVTGPGSERIVQNLARAGLPCLIINRTSQACRPCSRSSRRCSSAASAPIRSRSGVSRGASSCGFTRARGWCSTFKGPCWSQQCSSV